MIATFKVQDPIEQPESNNPAYAVKSDDGKTKKTKSSSCKDQRRQHPTTNDCPIQLKGEKPKKIRSKEKPTQSITLKLLKKSEN